MYLGVKRETATVGEIAEQYGISRNHLVKVVHHLGKLGYIHTSRGKSGGITLAGEPEAINVGEVIRRVEPNFYIVECFNESANGCPITPACLLRGMMFEAYEAFFGVLDKYTLSDLLENSEALRGLLENGAAVESRPIADISRTQRDSI